jgi:hypothetical protein
MRRGRAFTLLEICLCVAILTIAAGAMGWQIKKMIDRSRAERSVSNFAAQLKTLQLIAMSYQSDLRVELFFDAKGKLFYKQIADDPRLQFLPERLKQVDGIVEVKKGKEAVKRITLNLFSSGRVEPEGVLGFRGDADLWIDLSEPIQIKLALSEPKRVSSN